MRTLSLLAVCGFFGLASLGVLLADRLVRTRGQAWLRTYAVHLSLWYGHALLQITLMVVGSAFLPGSSWGSLGLVLGPLITLLAGAAFYVLALFAARVADRSLPRPFTVLYVALWAGLVLYFALNAGGGSTAADGRFPRIYAISFFGLKAGTVLGAMGYLLHQAAGRESGERRALRAVAWTYLSGFLAFQALVAGIVPIESLPGHDYFIALIQIAYHFPVLAALSLYAKRRATVRGGLPGPVVEAGAMDDLGLSPREAEIAGLVMRGFSNKEIEQALFISVETVKKHLTSIFRKTGVKSRLQLSLLVGKKQT